MQTNGLGCMGNGKWTEQNIMLHFLLSALIKVNIVQNVWLCYMFPFVKKTSGHFSMLCFSF